MWKLTREAETDEALIEDLKKILGEVRLRENKLIEENDMFKRELQDAFSKIKDCTEYLKSMNGKPLHPA